VNQFVFSGLGNFHPFMVNNKKYASVVHYYQGSKLKNGFPDFFDSAMIKNLVLKLNSSIHRLRKDCASIVKLSAFKHNFIKLNVCFYEKFQFIANKLNAFSVRAVCHHHICFCLYDVIVIYSEQKIIHYCSFT
jgi:hypothetical protein